MGDVISLYDEPYTNPKDSTAMTPIVISSNSWYYRFLNHIAVVPRKGFENSCQYVRILIYNMLWLAIGVATLALVFFGAIYCVIMLAFTLGAVGLGITNIFLATITGLLSFAGAFAIIYGFRLIVMKPSEKKDKPASATSLFISKYKDKICRKVIIE